MSTTAFEATQDGDDGVTVADSEPPLARKPARRTTDPRLESTRSWDTVTGYALCTCLDHYQKALASNPTLPRYSYKPIARDEVRVLTLHGTDDESQPLCGNLSTHHETDVFTDDKGRSKHTSYEAFSYTWGPSDDDVDLLLDGRSFRIGWNLYLALSRLRPVGGRRRRLWVDAICINQEDDAEKTVQVASMWRIYAMAVHVVAWLGEDSPEEDGRLSCAFFNWMQQDKIRPAALAANVAFYNQAVMAPTTLGMPLTVGHVVRFLSRDWFTRRWVIQEFLLAHDVIFICGSSKTSQEAVLRVTSCREIVNLHCHRLFERTRSRSPSIVASLETFHDFECRDPRDRIAALLNAEELRANVVSATGVATGVNIIDVRTFQVDYARSVEDNYLGFARDLVSNPKPYIRRQDTGAFLARVLQNAAQRRSSHSQMPASWVPDWRCPAKPLSESPNDLSGLPQSLVRATVIWATRELEAFAHSGSDTDPALLLTFRVRTNMETEGHSNDVGDFQELAKEGKTDTWGNGRRYCSSRIASDGDLVCYFPADANEQFLAIVFRRVGEDDGQSAWRLRAVENADDLLAFERQRYWKLDPEVADTRKSSRAVLLLVR